MTRSGWARLTLLTVVAVAFAAPASAWAHAALLRTSPAATSVVNTPPAQLRLTYSEAVEPRFAIVSVSDAAGHQHAAGRPYRSPSNPDELVQPLDHLDQGWYLVFWRVISADGHPVRGAYTFAVGPNPGPAPQFVIPSISETAATPRLLVERWVVFLSLMSAVGLLLIRLLTARPIGREQEASSLRAISIAFFVSAAVALVSVPIYVLTATAQFALRSIFDVFNLVPLARASAFGRGYLDLELTFLLFTIAGAIAIFVDRPERRQRSVAEILALTGALAAAAATLLIPGLSGHAGQTAPRGLSLVLDWLHLTAGSIWIGGLIGLLVLWFSLRPERRTEAIATVVPRFSRIAFVSVMILTASGIWASVLHLPTLPSLWQTSYGVAILVKVALLAGAMVLAAVNLGRTKPRLAAAAEQPETARGAASLLRVLVSGEVILVVAAIFAAGVLSSLAPPAKALATVGSASAHVGPGAVSKVVVKNGYTLLFTVDPNRAAAPNTVRVRITKAGVRVRGADVTATFIMLDMEMGRVAYTLPETEPGVYARSAPALVMVGHWGLSFDIRPPGATPFTVLLVDKAAG
jgi:copper transport protein